MSVSIEDRMELGSELLDKMYYPVSLNEEDLQGALNPTLIDRQSQVEGEEHLQPSKKSDETNASQEVGTNQWAIKN